MDWYDNKKEAFLFHVYKRGGRRTVAAMSKCQMVNVAMEFGDARACLLLAHVASTSFYFFANLGSIF